MHSTRILTVNPHCGHIRKQFRCKSKCALTAHKFGWRMQTACPHKAHLVNVKGWAPERWSCNSPAVFARNSQMRQRKMANSTADLGASESVTTWYAASSVVGSGVVAFDPVEGAIHWFKWFKDSFNSDGDGPGAGDSGVQIGSVWTIESIKY